MNDDINTLTLAGTVAAEPEHRTTSRGKAFAVVLIETRVTWSNRQGNSGERVSVVPVTCWSTRMLPASGDRVRVEGRLTARPYTGRDGVERHIVDIAADSITPLVDADESSPPSDAASENRRQRGGGGGTAEPRANPTPGAPIDDSDIPF